MKHLRLALLALTLSTPAWAGSRPSLLTAELMGRGGFVSVNGEWAVSSRAHLGAGLGAYGGGLSIPLYGLFYVAPGSDFQVFATGGMTLVFGSEPVFDVGLGLEIPIDNYFLRVTPYFVIVPDGVYTEGSVWAGFSFGMPF